VVELAPITDELNLAGKSQRVPIRSGVYQLLLASAANTDIAGGLVNLPPAARPSL